LLSFPPGFISHPLTIPMQFHLSDNEPSLPLPKIPITSVAEYVERTGQIYFKTEQGHLHLYLPSSRTSEAEWLELWYELQQRIESSKRFWPANTIVYLFAGDRLMDQRQLQQVATSLSEANLHLSRIFTSRRQTAIVAATAGFTVEQQAPTLALSMKSLTKVATPTPESFVVEPIYLQSTLRSGREIRHPGSVVVVGDINPGGVVIADGDILIWGRLRGIAHAGASGNRHCRIMALQMEPTQLRIADQVARAPEKTPHQFYPEVAYIGQEGIQIAKASDFSKVAEGIFQGQRI
jgi:septum site-determining protein MinC